MKYEISDEVRGNILSLIAAANIKGSDAPAVMQVAQTLNKPIVEDVKDIKEVADEKSDKK